MDRQLKGHRALRKGRYSQSCHFYHVVVRAAAQRQPFECLYNSRLLVRVLMEQWQRRHAETLAYCLMPDHLHWLIRLENDTLPLLIKRVKSISTLNMGYSVWQRGYYDHLIRSDENLVNVARYIVRNPLEAGLVSSVRDYPHWDSVWL